MSNETNGNLSRSSDISAASANKKQASNNNMDLANSSNNYNLNHISGNINNNILNNKEILSGDNNSTMNVNNLANNTKANKDLNTLSVSNPLKILATNANTATNAVFNVISDLNTMTNNLCKSSLAANLCSIDAKNLESISKEKESFIDNTNINNSKINANINSSFIGKKIM